MNFEECLKKYVVGVDAFNMAVDDPTRMSYVFKAISLQALGEWAWERYQLEIVQYEIAEKSKEIKWSAIGFSQKAALCVEIAIACIGRKEIKKRLKEEKK